MSQVVLGTWPLSGDFGPVELSQIEKTFNSAFEAGFVEFDTAPNYGNGFIEFCIGKVFCDRKNNIRVNTKCGNRPFIGKSFKKEDIIQSVDQSLKRLSIECINILYLHNPRTEIEDYAQYLDLMSELKKAGKIAYSGLSMAKGTVYPDLALQGFDFLQDDINLLYQKPLSLDANIAKKLYARSPLASGILGGHINLNSKFSEQDQRFSWLKGERLASIVKRLNKIKEVSNMPMDQLARKFLLQEENLGGVIFGIKRPEHIKAIADDLNSSKISNETIMQLKNEYLNDFGLVGEAHLSY